MKILIYGINYRPEMTGIGKYTGEMAPFMAAEGHEVEVITAPPYYPNWRVAEDYRGRGWVREEEDGVTVLRCPLYVPAEPSGAKRIVHEFSFLLSSLRYWIPRFFRRYDAIVCVSPPFHLGFLALLHHWLRGTPVVNHIQDLQVDAARGMGLIKSEGLLTLLERMERFLLRRFTRVSSISEGMIDRIVAKGVRQEDILFFPNWVDAKLVHPVPRAESMRREWGIADNEKLVLYSGNLGGKQGLENLPILAAAYDKRQPEVRFVVVGEGGTKQDLIRQVKELGLSNVEFKPLQPLEKLAASLAAADVHLVLQKAEAADLVMPSKLTNILAVGGHALVTANPGTTLYEVVREHRLGTVVPAEDAAALRRGLDEILSGTRSADAGGAVAYATKHLDKQTTIRRYLRQLAELNTI